MTPEQWILGIVGALLIGLGKGGLPGAGNLTVAIYALIFEARASVGILLPVLIAADVVAVLVYRRHADWFYLVKLLPWMGAGILVGYASLWIIQSAAMAPLIGGILLSMTALHFLRVWHVRRYADGILANVPQTLGFQAGTGILGGFATMVANAAGPVAALYLLAVGLPKMAFIGTAAWCFFIVNLVKVPFMMHLDMIHFESARISLSLAPFAMLGAAIAPFIVRFIPQRLFEVLVWAFVILAGARLILG